MTSDKQRVTFLKSSQSHVTHLTVQDGSLGVCEIYLLEPKWMAAFYVLQI